MAAELQVRHNLPDDVTRRKVRQLHYANRRALLLVRALTSFYLSLGAFAAASFVSLLGAVFAIAKHDIAREAAMVFAFLAGLIGISGVVFGSAILVLETRLTLAILREETELTVRSLSPEQGGAGQ